MPQIRGRTSIILQAGDIKVGVTIRVKSATSSSSNDGFLPYNITVSGVSTIIYDEDGTDVTSDMKYANPTVSGGEYVKIELKAADPFVEGRYILDHTLTLSDGGTRHLTFRRIYAKDLK